MDGCLESKQQCVRSGRSLKNRGVTQEASGRNAHVSQVGNVQIVLQASRDNKTSDNSNTLEESPRCRSCWFVIEFPLTHMSSGAYIYIKRRDECVSGSPNTHKRPQVTACDLLYMLPSEIYVFMCSFSQRSRTFRVLNVLQNIYQTYPGLWH